MSGRAIAQLPLSYAIMPTLEEDSSGQSFRLVLCDGRPFGRVYRWGGLCRFEFNDTARNPIVRESVGEIYSALLNWGHV